MNTGKSQINSAKVIKFDDLHDPLFGTLSPLSADPIIIRRQQYPSLHHYFLCERFKDCALERQIREATTAGELDRLSKEAEAQGYERPEWERVKLDVMLVGTYFKFKQNEEPRKVLLSTAQQILVNHTVKDDFWGDGGDGSGKNIMGVTLMVVRDRLRREGPQHSVSDSMKQKSRKSGVRVFKEVASSRQLAH